MKILYDSDCTFFTFWPAGHTFLLFQFPITFYKDVGGKDDTSYIQLYPLHSLCYFPRSTFPTIRAPAAGAGLSFPKGKLSMPKSWGSMPPGAARGIAFLLFSFHSVPICLLEERRKGTNTFPFVNFSYSGCFNFIDIEGSLGGFIVFLHERNNVMV